MIPVAAANADSIDFPLDGGEGLTSFTKTVSSVTLTVDDPVPSIITAVPNFYLSGTTYGLMQGFNLQFDTDVYITGYTIGYSASVSGAYFDITGPNGNSLNNVIQTGAFSTTSPVLLRSGETATLLAVFPEAGAIAELPILTVDTTAIPEPGAWLLLGSGLVGLIALRVRRAPNSSTH